MAMHKFCTKCRSAKPLATIGTNGICKDCMIDAIESSPQAKEEMSNGTDDQASDNRISIMKPDEAIVFATKKKAANYLGVSHQKITAALRYDKKIDGWDIIG